jgi:rubrerythrin
MNDDRFQDLLYQTFETELGGTRVYETALRCAKDEGLRSEFEKYLEQTRHHVELVEKTLRAFGLDPDREAPGRAVIRLIGESLVKAMEMALRSGSPASAQLVATECVTLAETKDHLNWELLGECLSRVHGEGASALRSAHKEVEDQEDEHLYHSTGWCRELWLAALGVPAVLPPPEEQKDVKTEIGAARAKQLRDKLT